MIQRRKVAYRHVRKVHYHHRIPVTSKVFQKRFHHKRYFVGNSITDKQGSSVTRLGPLAISHTEAKEHHKANMKGLLFSSKKKKKDQDYSNKKTNIKKKKHGKHYALKKFIAKLIIVAVIIWAVLKFVFGIEILYGNYMFPAVRDGDLVISYKLQSPITNDLVMYTHNGETRVGRVVAKENAIIRFDSETETYSVNGVTPSEEIFYTTVSNPDSDIEYPYTVPAGCVYVLNDHREDMTDSRTYEAIPMNEVQGVVVFVIRRRGF